jgi:hypothetical protein
MKFEIKYDDETDEVVIAGTKYSGHLFRAFSDEKIMPLNTPFELTKREDGVITIHDLRGVQ